MHSLGVCQGKRKPHTHNKTKNQNPPLLKYYAYHALLAPLPEDALLQPCYLRFLISQNRSCLPSVHVHSQKQGSVK
jgi:hypothetical protein